MMATAVAEPVDLVEGEDGVHRAIEPVEVVEGEVVGERVDEIRELWSKVDAADLASDPTRWRIAELVYAELEANTKPKALADALGKTTMHVTLMRRAWEHYLEDPAAKDRPFGDAYKLAKQPRSGRKPRFTRGANKSLSVVDLKDMLGAFVLPDDAVGDDVDALLDEAEAFIERLRGWIEEAAA
jgi:hypothetical protein